MTLRESLQLAKLSEGKVYWKEVRSLVYVLGGATYQTLVPSSPFLLPGHNEVSRFAFLGAPSHDSLPSHFLL